VKPRSGDHTLDVHAQYRALGCILLFAIALVAAAGGCAEEVETRIVLRIGTYELSVYALEKNFRQFFTSWNAQHQGPPSMEEQKAWAEHFLARQVLTAQAKIEGFFERDEVTGITARMERHMLIQPPDGPLYRQLLHPATPEKRLSWFQAFQVFRTELLAAIRYQQEPGATQRLFASISRLPRNSAFLPADLARNDAEETLFAYQSGTARVRVTASEFIANYNAGFVRRLPTTATELQAACEDQAVGAVAYARALELRLNQEPRFEEDRKNFLARQAFDLFERERIKPRFPNQDEEGLLRHESALARELAGKLAITDTVEWTTLGLTVVPSQPWCRPSAATPP
jgi:hypothetical protein